MWTGESKLPDSMPFAKFLGSDWFLLTPISPDDPKFTIRVRPRYQQPDLFYANRYMKLIEAELFSEGFLPQ